MNQKQTRLLFELLSQPTAPFRERHVIDVVAQSLSSSTVPFFIDPVGNIVIGVRSRTEYRGLINSQTKEPVRLFIAHMDHPGFHGVRWLSRKRLLVKWHGGSPVKHLAATPVWLATDEGRCAEGRMTQVRIIKAGWSIDTAEIVLTSDGDWAKRPSAKEVFGSFRFPKPVWQQRKRLYANAIDDLVGVFAIVNTAIKLFSSGSSRNRQFLGLLTRAEEVGFVGAVDHFDLGWLNKRKRPVICVSLEASRTLPGAEIGKGPIVRLGDRRTVFSADYSKVLIDVADKVLSGRYQQRIMDGGSCEATAATVFGLPAIGISLPLGNYHNQGLEGGAHCPKPEGPAPEFVHMDDIEGELKLCHALMKNGLCWTQPWEKQRQQLKKNSKRYNRLMVQYS